MKVQMLEQIGVYKKLHAQRQFFWVVLTEHTHFLNIQDSLKKVISVT